MWFYLLLAIVEGATELLPVSSTAHMLLLYALLGRIPTSFDEILLVVIQAFAGIGIVARYYKILYKRRELLLNISVTTVVTAFIAGTLKVGFGFDFSNVGRMLISTNLLIGGIMFLVVSRLPSGVKDSLKIRDAFILGVIQGLAVFPGVSRSGVVVLGMLLLGYRFKYALEYGFLTSMPILSIAALYEGSSFILNSMGVGLGLYEILILTVTGSVSALIVYLLVNILPRIPRRTWLVGFGVYRVVIGILLILGQYLF